MIHNSKEKRELENNNLSFCHCGIKNCTEHEDWTPVTQGEISIWKRVNEYKQSEKVDTVNCRLYKRDWYVGAQIKEDGLWHSVVGRQTYDERGVVHTNQIFVKPSEVKSEVIGQTQKNIDIAVRHWALSRSKKVSE